MEAGEWKGPLSGFPHLSICFKFVDTTLSGLDCSSPSSVNVALFGNRIFADVIN